MNDSNARMNEECRGSSSFDRPSKKKFHVAEKAMTHLRCEGQTDDACVRAHNNISPFAKDYHMILETKQQCQILHDDKR